MRTLRLVRLATILAEIHQEARWLIARHKLLYIVLITDVVVLGASGATFLARSKGQPDRQFRRRPLVAITTVTTVGYGDTYPVTPASRGIAAFLMMAGIAFSASSLPTWSCPAPTRTYRPPRRAADRAR